MLQKQCYKNTHLLYVLRRNNFNFLRKQILSYAYLVITLDRPSPAPSVRPQAVFVPHPILTATTGRAPWSSSLWRMTLPRTWSARSWTRPVPDAADIDHRAPSQVRKVTVFGSLRTKHQRFANRRELAADYSLRQHPLNFPCANRTIIARTCRPHRFRYTDQKDLRWSLPASAAPPAPTGHTLVFLTGICVATRDV